MLMLRGTSKRHMALVAIQLCIIPVHFVQPCVLLFCAVMGAYFICRQMMLFAAHIGKTLRLRRV